MIYIDLKNDQKVQCSLGLMSLKKLRGKSKSLYATANKTILKGVDDIEEIVETIYAGYVASNDVTDYNLEEFAKLLPDSPQELCELIQKAMQ